MEAQWNEIRLERTAGTAAAQTAVKSSIPLPRDRTAQRLLHAAPEIRGVEARAAAGAVTVTGTLLVKSIFLSPEGQPFALESEARFSHTLPVADARPGDTVQAAVQLPEFDARLRSGAVAVEALLEIALFLTREETVRCLSGAAGLVCRTGTVELPRQTELGTERFHRMEEIPVAGVAQVLLGDCTVQTHGAQWNGETAQVTGTLTFCALCLTHGGELRQIHQNVPFTEAVAVDSFPAETAVAARVTDCALQTPEGEDLLRCEVTLEVTLTGTETESVTLVTDAYAPDLSCGTEVRVLYPADGRGSCCKRIPLGETVAVPPELPEVYRTAGVTARAVVTGRSEENGMLALDCVLFAQLLYQTQTGEVWGFAEEIPLRLLPDVPFDGDSPAGVEVLFAQVSGSGRRLDLSGTLAVTAGSCAGQPVRMVTALKEDRPAPPPWGLLACLARSGDTLWDVAKRFCVPVEAVQKLNPGLCDPLSEGQPVLVLSPKR